jgi:hypothetical protein
MSYQPILIPTNTMYTNCSNERTTLDWKKIMECLLPHADKEKKNGWQLIVAN